MPSCSRHQAGMNATPPPTRDGRVRDTPRTHRSTKVGCRQYRIARLEERGACGWLRPSQSRYSNQLRRHVS